MIRSESCLPGSDSGWVAGGGDWKVAAGCNDIKLSTISSFLSTSYLGVILEGRKSVIIIIIDNRGIKVKNDLTRRLSVCLRILLIFIAILSAYSIHLLLKCAGVVGELAQRAPRRHRRTLSPSRSLTCLQHVCVFSLRHPRLRAAREPGFRSSGEAVGRLHHHRSQHRRLAPPPSFHLLW